MQFIKTLFPAFFIWQFFSLRPFTLIRISLRPMMNNINAFVSVISFITQTAFLLYGLLNFEYYVAFEGRTFIMSASDMLSMTLVRFTSVSIVLESWLKRSHQIEFLRKIDRIDDILNTNLLINNIRSAAQKEFPAVDCLDRIIFTPWDSHDSHNNHQRYEGIPTLLNSLHNSFVHLHDAVSAIHRLR